MGETLILGGRGFVGRAVQSQVGSRSREYVFVSRADPRGENLDLRTLQIDLLDRTQVVEVANFDHAIWVAGSAEHGLGWFDPIADLELQVGTLLHFLEHFRGSLTFLSSQATYYGLGGEVVEGVDHVPDMPYGFAKLAAEQYARWALQASRLRQLWIHRLMYAYGENERPRRLLARCVQASRDGGHVTVSGGGRSFLNPLPVAFVAEVLLRSSDQMKDEPDGFQELTNMNHPDCWTVIDVLRAFRQVCSFDYEVVERGEEWPVSFHGNVDTLKRWLGRWGLSFPTVESGLADYRERAMRSTTA